MADMQVAILAAISIINLIAALAAMDKVMRDNARVERERMRRRRHFSRIMDVPTGSEFAEEAAALEKAEKKIIYLQAGNR